MIHRKTVRHAIAALVLALGAAASALLAFAPPDSPSAETAAAAPAPVEPPTLIDANGLPYREIRLEKRPGTFVREGENRVRIFGGYTFEILSETEAEFVLKQYLPSGDAPQRKPKRAAPDLAAIARTYEVSIPSADRLRLVPFDRGLPRDGQWRNGFDIADFDADGAVEILFGPARKGRPYPNLFRHTGGGSWIADTTRRFAAGRYDYGDAKAADLNGDGKLDVAFGFHLLGMTAQVDDGTGKLVAWSRGLEMAAPGVVGGAFSSRAFQIADWNADGRPDLIALGDGPSSPAVAAATGPATAAGSATAAKPLAPSMGLVIYLNGGDGSWARQADASPGSRDLFGDSIAVGDLDRDGDPDLVVGVRRIGRRSILGYRQSDGSIDWKELEGLRRQAMIDGAVIADLDGDGWNDILIGYRNFEGVWRSGIDLFFGGADGFVRQPLMAREGSDSMLAVAVGDLNGDGSPDIALLPRMNEAILFLAETGRRYVSESTTAEELEAGEERCAGYAARIADLDGDGRAELIAAFAGDPSARDALGLPADEGCASSGSLRAWKVSLAASMDAKPAKR